MTSTFSHTSPITASRETAWRALQLADTWSNIGPIDEVWDAEYADNGTLTAYRWSARAAGRSWNGTATTVEAEPDRLMRLDLVSSEIAGAITVELGDEKLTVSMEAAPKGLLAQMFWGTVKTALEKGLATQVEAFARGLSQ